MHSAERGGHPAHGKLQPLPLPYPCRFLPTSCLHCTLNHKTWNKSETPTPIALWEMSLAEWEAFVVRRGLCGGWNRVEIGAVGPHPGLVGSPWSTSPCVELLEKPIRRNQTCAYELCCSAGVFLAALGRETAEGRIQQSRSGSAASNTQAKPDLTHGCRLGHFAFKVRHRQVICEESC